VCYIIKCYVVKCYKIELFYLCIYSFIIQHKTHNMADIQLIYKMREQQKNLTQKIDKLNEELSELKEDIKNKCPHSNISHYRSSEYHEVCHWYLCNICNTTVKYKIYQNYLTKYKKNDVIIYE